MRDKEEEIKEKERWNEIKNSISAQRLGLYGYIRGNARHRNLFRYSFLILCKTGESGLKS